MAEKDLLHLHPADNVAIARRVLRAGSSARTDAGLALTLLSDVPAGHKVALAPLAAGDPVRRYGQVIGLATQPITPGDHVHVQNLGIDEFARAAAAAEPPTYPLASDDDRVFEGYLRPDGRVGTRNYVAVLSTVNCSAHVTRQIAAHFSPDRLAAFPHVDGVVPFTHGFGCTFPAGSRDQQMLARTLAGMACHPNTGAYLLVGHGCEKMPVAELAGHLAGCTLPCASLVVQDAGGTARAIEAGIAHVEQLLAQANETRRTPQPLSELVLGLHCGGSDAWSGVTANPAVGLVADELVRRGGSAVLAETPEIFGAEHLLLARAANPAVARALEDKVAWWRGWARLMGFEIDQNRSPGNEAGGLTTIYEKSLGAVSKAGSTPLVAVYDYAGRVQARGLSFMDTPGYDPVGVTGQVAGGCTVVVFTTGRGSVWASKPAPVIKVCTNSATYSHMAGDMDLDAGQVLSGTPLDEVASTLLDLVVAVASGHQTKSETRGNGEGEFVVWNLGSTL